MDKSINSKEDERRSGGNVPQSGGGGLPSNTNAPPAQGTGNIPLRNSENSPRRNVPPPQSESGNVPPARGREREYRPNSESGSRSNGGGVHSPVPSNSNPPPPPPPSSQISLPVFFYPIYIQPFAPAPNPYTSSIVPSLGSLGFGNQVNFFNSMNMPWFTSPLATQPPGHPNQARSAENAPGQRNVQHENRQEGHIDNSQKRTESFVQNTEASQLPILEPQPRKKIPQSSVSVPNKPISRISSLIYDSIRTPETLEAIQRYWPNMEEESILREIDEIVSSRENFQISEESFKDLLGKENREELTVRYQMIAILALDYLRTYLTRIDGDLYLSSESRALYKEYARGLLKYFTEFIEKSQPKK